MPATCCIPGFQSGCRGNDKKTSLFHSPSNAKLCVRQKRAFLEKKFVDLAFIHRTTVYVRNILIFAVLGNSRAGKSIFEVQSCSWARL